MEVLSSFTSCVCRVGVALAPVSNDVTRIILTTFAVKCTRYDTVLC
jgi:hypothetical protein